MNVKRCLARAFVLISLGTVLAAQPSASPSPLNLDGHILGQVTQHDAMMLNFHAPMLVNRLRDSGKALPKVVDDLIKAGNEAYDQADYYRAYRLYVRAIGFAQGEDRLEACEVAASYKLLLDRAIIARGERIDASITPLFTIGHPLAGRYHAHVWLESDQGVLPAANHTVRISGLNQIRVSFPAQQIKPGVVAVGYRLTASDGETLAEIRQAVFVAPDAAKRLQRLQTRLAAVKQSLGSAPPLAVDAALATIEYDLESFKQERTTFSGNWQRAAHPFGMYLARVNFTAIGRDPGRTFPAFNGRLRYPEDVTFAETLLKELGSDRNALLEQSGDRTQAVRVDGKLQRYRIYVPRANDRSRQYSLIVALHSGGGDGTYFDWESSFSNPPSSNENAFKQLAQQRGYIVLCPQGSSGTFLEESDFPNIIALTRTMRELYSVSPDRVFVTGWSMGGSAAWKLGIQHPELFRALASVDGAADWLSREVTDRANALPVLYAVTDVKTDYAQKTSTLAKSLLPNFSIKEFPDTDHITLWSRALPEVFDFFDTQPSASAHSD